MKQGVLRSECLKVAFEVRGPTRKFVPLVERRELTLTCGHRVWVTVASQVRVLRAWCPTCRASLRVRGCWSWRWSGWRGGWMEDVMFLARSALKGKLLELDLNYGEAVTAAVLREALHERMEKPSVGQPLGQELAGRMSLGEPVHTPGQMGTVSKRLVAVLQVTVEFPAWSPLVHEAVEKIHRSIPPHQLRRFDLRVEPQ